jgi:predicted CopG family antitoxin
MSRITKTVEVEVEVELDDEDVRELLGDLQTDDLVDIIENLNTKETQKLISEAFSNLRDSDVEKPIVELLQEFGSWTNAREEVQRALDVARSIMEHAMNCCQSLQQRLDELKVDAA